MAALPVDPEDGAQGVAASVALDPTGTGQSAQTASPATSAPAVAGPAAPSGPLHALQQPTAAEAAAGNTKNFTPPPGTPDGLTAGDPRAGTERTLGPSHYDTAAVQAEGPPSPPANAQGAPGRPQGAVATAQSEPVPQTPKIQNGSRYLALEKMNPQLFALINHAAEVVGVPATDLANIAWVENRFKFGNAPTSPKGAVGPMQVLPDTAHGLDPSGHLDVYNPSDNVLLGAMAYKQGAERYGMSTPGAFGSYFAGSPKYDMAAANPSKYPTLVNQIHGYINAINGQSVDGGGGDTAGGGAVAGHNYPLNTGGDIQPAGLVQAAAQGGPDGAISYMTSNGPKGMGMTDLWRNAESQLVNAFISKGDIAGAQHARDFMLQLSHTGSNQYLMAAQQALAAGDGVGAAQSLAKAHAFFPDGTIGRFRSNGTNVWAERLDENNPDQRIGQSFQVTPQNVANLLNQTTDPQEFLKTLNAEQKNVADVNHQNATSQYLAGLPQSRQNLANTRAEAQVTAAGVRAKGTVDAATVRAAAEANKPDRARERMIEEETNRAYDPSMSPDQTPEGQHQFAMQGSVYRALRQENVSGPQSKVLAQGLASGEMMMRPTTDGRMGVVDSKGNALTYLPASVMARLGGATASPAPNAAPMGGGTPPTPTSPVGAMAGSMAARVGGVTNNLSGTVTPQSQPQQPQQ